MAQAPLIPYATETVGQPSDRLLRFIVALAAIAYSVKALIVSGLHFALAYGWADSPDTMGWSIDSSSELAMSIAGMVPMLGLVAGGILLLRLSKLSIPVIRISIIVSMALSIASLARLLYSSPTYASYWSEPATCAIYTLNFIADQWLPVLLLCLTLRPLARRIGGR